MQKILKLVDENYKESMDRLNVSILESIGNRLETVELAVLACVYNNDEEYQKSMDIFQELLDMGYEMKAIYYYHRAYAQFYLDMDENSIVDINHALKMEASAKEQEWFKKLKQNIEEFILEM